MSIAIILGVVCTFFILCAIGLNLFARYANQTQTVPAAAQITGKHVALQPVIQVPATVSTPAQAPIFSICLASGLFFDPIINKFTLPPGVTVLSATSNYAYSVHDITLGGVNLPRRSRVFILHSDLVVVIEERGNTLRIHTQHGATFSHCPKGSYIQLKNLRDIYHTIVVIDPGHGGMDTGAVNVLGSGAPSESDIVLAISQKLLGMFDEPGVLLVPTRTEDVFMQNNARYRLANRIADYFISIHVNACEVSRQSGGTLTLYGNAPGSAGLADTFQGALADALGSRNRGTEHSTAFRILNGANVPVIILELLFLSNPEEAALLGDKDTQMLIAQTLAEAIGGLHGRLTEKPSG